MSWTTLATRPLSSRRRHNNPNRRKRTLGLPYDAALGKWSLALRHLPSRRRASRRPSCRHKRHWSCRPDACSPDTDRRDCRTDADTRFQIKRRGALARHTTTQGNRRRASRPQSSRRPHTFISNQATMTLREPQDTTLTHRRRHNSESSEEEPLAPHDKTQANQRHASRRLSSWRRNSISNKATASIGMPHDTALTNRRLPQDAYCSDADTRLRVKRTRASARHARRLWRPDAERGDRKRSENDPRDTIISDAGSSTSSIAMLI
jgi:hypothetical protein